MINNHLDKNKHDKWQRSLCQTQHSHCKNSPPLMDPVPPKRGGKAMSSGPY